MAVDLGCIRQRSLSECGYVRVLQETKDLETTIAGLRSEKVKAETAEKAAVKKGALSTASRCSYMGHSNRIPCKFLSCAELLLWL